MVSHCGFNLQISLMTNDVEHLSCAYSLYMYLFWQSTNIWEMKSFLWWLLRGLNIEPIIDVTIYCLIGVYLSGAYCVLIMLPVVLRNWKEIVVRTLGIKHCRFYLNVSWCFFTLSIFFPVLVSWLWVWSWLVLKNRYLIQFVLTFLVRVLVSEPLWSRLLLSFIFNWYLFIVCSAFC